MSQDPTFAERRVLAAIDVSGYAASVAAHGGWAASRLGTPLELMHAIDRDAAPVPIDLTGNLYLGTQEGLLEEMTLLDEQRGKLAQQRGRVVLQQAREIAESHGVAATVRQRHGALADTLLEIEDEIRLFVLGKRGENADFARGHLGSNLERVIRAINRPLLVTPRAWRPIQRFMIAFDGSATTRRCVELVSASPLLRGLECDVLTVGAAAEAQAEPMQWAQTQLQAAGFSPQMRAVPGAPESVIAEQVAARSIDLLVMGAYGHSRIRNLIVGSTTTQVVRNCPIAVLLLR
ncbi:MAG: universal stress protein [Lysobacter sp.]